MLNNSLCKKKEKMPKEVGLAFCSFPFEFPNSFTPITILLALVSLREKGDWGKRSISATMVIQIPNSKFQIPNSKFQIPNSFLSAGAAQHNGRGVLLFLIPLK
ncbi:MAG TPA: hypothetical protein VKY57_03315 [Chitinispirillaceae bacterium]|nr:hypothetical protein [Chitinispirillaceae bacterium]